MIKTIITSYFVFAILVSASPRYDQTTWLCTHNSYNASNSGFRFTNHTLSIKEQLQSGVRAFMLDIHRANNKIVLSHGTKALYILGSTPLEKELKTYHDFLTKNPEAILTFIIESSVSAKDVTDAITASGLDKFAHTQDRNKPWPTLQQLRKSAKRLIIFSDRTKGKKIPLWYHDIWTHCTETHWSNKTPQNLLANRPGRGKKDNPLFILNHFILNPISKPSLAQSVNNLPFLKKRYKTFQKSHPNRRPNFITIDFSNKGNALKFVESLNIQTP